MKGLKALSVKEEKSLVSQKDNPKNNRVGLQLATEGKTTTDTEQITHSTSHSNPYLSMLGYSTSVIALAALLTYGYITVYYSGYLRAFDIDIRSIDFFPKIIDLSFWGVVVCVTLLSGVGIFLLSMYASSRLSDKAGNALAAKYKKLYWLKSDGDATPRIVLAIVVVGAVLFLSFSLVFYVADKQGYAMGKNEERFTVVVDDTITDKNEVLIYQNGGIGVFKLYDKSTKAFGDTYSIESIEDKTFRSILLDRK